MKMLCGMPWRNSRFAMLVKERMLWNSKKDAKISLTGMG